MKYDQVTVRWANGEVLVGTHAGPYNREGFIEDSALTSRNMAITYGEAWLAAHAEQTIQADLELHPTRDVIRPWSGVGKGDALGVRTKQLTSVEAGRVHGVGFTGLRRGGTPRWTFTVGSSSQERQIRAARELGKLTAGSMRGTFGAATPNLVPSYGSIPSGKLPADSLAIGDTDEFRLDEPYDRTRPDPFEERKAIIRFDCVAESLVGTDDSKIEVWRVSYNDDGTIATATEVDEFTWPGDAYRFTHITELLFDQGQAVQLRSVLAPGAGTRLDEISPGSIGTGAHRLISIKPIASTAN